jgi:hypothetical protein
MRKRGIIMTFFLKIVLSIDITYHSTMPLKWILLSTYLFSLRCDTPLHKSENINLPHRDTTKEYAGVVEFVIKLVDPSAPANAEPLWTVPVKIWYNDSMAIEEVATLHFITDSKNNTTQRIDINSYRFVDLRKRSIYVYKSFSDTAAIIKKYSFDDKTAETGGGWQFNTKKDSDYIGEHERLTDTTIADVKYSRIKLKRKWNELFFFSTLFFRCDILKSPFTFYSQLSQQIGCPAVKFLSEYPNHKKFSTLEEINFLRNQFTPDEMNVFSVWARNAADQPLLQK